MKKLLSLLMLSIAMTASADESKVELTLTNSVIIRGSINETSINKAIKELISLNSQRVSESKVIYIVMDSPGGSIFAGNKFIRFVNTIPNVKTICIYCASMAHGIMQGVKGERLALPDNLLMAHRASGSVSGQFEDGELESQLEMIKKVVRSMEQRNADRIGISLKQYKKKVVNEWWTYGKESLKLNIIDKIVSVTCSKKLLEATETTKVMTLFGPIKGPRISKCPLT